MSMMKLSSPLAGESTGSMSAEAGAYRNHPVTHSEPSSSQGHRFIPEGPAGRSSFSYRPVIRNPQTTFSRVRSFAKRARP
jgi:hypothetical protein